MALSSERIYGFDVFFHVDGMDNMVTAVCFDQAAVISYIRYRTLCLFTGSGAEICAVFVKIFLGMEIYAGDIYIRKYLFVGESVIP